MDREEFGAFISSMRKEKNLTQKELADKLLISDKAVSKWERGLSYPDITMLEPLSGILGVSISELVLGRRNEMEAEKDYGEVVKQAMDIGNEQRCELEKKLRNSRIMVFVLLMVAVVLETVLLFMTGVDMEKASLHYWTVEGITVFFGIYYWIAAKEKIPTYYDEHKISCYSDGFMNMNFPGIHFNNTNWPHILKAVRIWCAAVMLLYPVLTWIIDKFPLNGLIFLPVIFAVVFSMIIPVYYCGKKYE
ncbi:MAG: helix-turn-helix transcriptional regulator [Eubacteriales bacterium]|nr:helix-turn-helix transcriptional regulator [Eubacteriales bacterium]